MTVREILVEALKAKGFDGLCSDGCGCDLSDKERDAAIKRVKKALVG